MIHLFKQRRKPNLALNYLVLGLLVFFAMGPLVVLGFNSFKNSAEIGRNPLGLPQHIIWENYPQAWVVGNFSTTTINTAILVAGTVVGVLVLGGMAAYSLTKLHLPGSDGFMLYLLVGSSLPVQLFLVPLFFLWRNMGLINNLFGLIIIYIALNSPFAIFLLHSYMLQLPSDFEDAARVDGANEWQVFTRVVVPLSWPGFLTAGLVVALAIWNEFLMATVFLTDQNLFTVVTSYYNFTTRFSRDWGLRRRRNDVTPYPVHLLKLATTFHRWPDPGRLKGLKKRDTLL